MLSKDIIELQNAIRATHECEARWEASVRVEEKFEGKTAWSGIVDVFALVDHPKAKYAYAWTYRDGDQNKTIVVLKIPPVDSPQTAVKVAITSKGRQISIDKNDGN
jgi:hypothetical protein